MNTRTNLQAKATLFIACFTITSILFAGTGLCVDKLIVKDANGQNSVFSVNDVGKITGKVGQIDGLLVPQWTVKNTSGNGRMDFMRGASNGVAQLLFGTLPATLEYQMGMFLDSKLQIRVVGGTQDSTKGITLTSTGDVGIGTTTPTSKMQVAGYLQLATNAGVPASTDCDSSTEYGRMIVDSTAGTSTLFICTPSGWSMK